MGIPYYFSHVVKEHSKIIMKYKDLRCRTNSLFLDSNSIVYDSVAYLSKMKSDVDFETRLIDRVCKKIEQYVKEIAPTDILYIAFDGVAPVAKLEQQRSRRYKSMLEKQVMGELLEKKDWGWDTTAITPGTAFMEKLNMSIGGFFEGREKRYKVKEIIFSGSDEAGEGEHKIFKYIRELRKKDDKMYKHVIYGLDADLIMLCVNHMRLGYDFYLYRETPEFIRSLNSDLNPSETYILDIGMFSGFLSEELSIGSKNRNNTLSDYIFITMLLGNDFLPHFPALNIRTGGIEKVLGAYKYLFGHTKSYIYDMEKNQIRWGEFKKLIRYLAEKEDEYIQKETIQRNRWGKRRYASGVTSKEDEIREKYLNIPLQSRESEMYIDPFTQNWEERYYEELFGVDVTDEWRKKICIKFMETMEWCIKYYTIGCIDWRFCYPYNYPPLLKDLYRYVPSFSVIMMDADLTERPISKHTQLAYVLPKQKLGLLPSEVVEKIKKSGKWEEWYGDGEGKLVWAYCKYIWESHVDLPEIDVEELEGVIGV